MILLSHCRIVVCSAVCLYKSVSIESFELKTILLLNVNKKIVSFIILTMIFLFFVVLILERMCGVSDVYYTPGGLDTPHLNANLTQMIILK